MKPRAVKNAMGACALISMSWAGIAEAGNLDAFYLSGEAALQGGAIVANTRSGGSLWYNPAGLAHLSGTRFDVNVSGYTIRFGATANFDSTLPNTKESRLVLLDIDVVPASVTLTRKFGDFGVGIGVFVPSQSQVDLRTHLEDPRDEDGNSLEFGYDTTSRFKEYHLGPGVGWQPYEGLSVGASLLANYRTRLERTDIAATIETEAGSQRWARHDGVDSQGVGLEMVFGTQWKIDSAWSLGAVMRTPGYSLGQAAHTVETEVLIDENGEEADRISFQKEFGLRTKVLSPFRFHLGGSYDVGSFRVSAEGSLLTALEDSLFEVQERTTWNGRVGLRWAASDFWSFGGGLFTDRSPIESPTQFQQSRLDYYGITLGLDWARSFGVFSQGTERLEEPKILLFGTTVALNYAIGIGEIAGARVGPDPAGGILFDKILSSVVAHEFTLHIGSSISE